jgi:hypothetical protein
MRPVRLAQIAAQAEGVRWRRRAKRAVTQVICLVLGLPFLLAAFGFLETAFWSYVVQHFQPVYAALIVMGGNMLVVLLLLVLAMRRGSHDTVELEALEVRRRALESAQRSISIAAMAGPIAGFLLSQLRSRRRRD